MHLNIKSIGLAVLAGICANFAIAQSRSDLMAKDLIVKNKIETASQWNHKIVKGKVDPKGYVSVITTYDDRGNAVLVENMKSNGSKSSTNEYIYDKNDNKLSYIQHQLIDGKWVESFKQIFTYDAKGQKAIEDGFDGKTTYKVKHTYFDNGKLQSILKTNAFGRVDEKWIFEYEGNTARISVYRPESTLNKVIVRKYDDAGNMVEETTLKDGKTELGRNIFRFNGNNKLVSKEEYYATQLRAKYEYKYSSNNLIEVYQTSASGETMLYSAYKYDDKGNMVEERWYDGEPNDYSNRKIQLDGDGNVNQVETYYSDYKYKVVYRYTYTFR